MTDYYAVLQVHASADPEVIEAAYRQLMKKYHPDRAGGDAKRAAVLHERAKIINEAYSVLRDPHRRYEYDARRLMGQHHPRPPQSPQASAARPAPGETADAPQAAVVDAAELQEQNAPPLGAWGPVLAPLGALATAYDLLPGRYEWEPGHGQEMLAALVLPPLGLGAWALATGRLAPLVGRAPLGALVAWALLVLLSVPAWRLLPRLVPAAGPSLLLLSGHLDAPLQQAHVPGWLAWMGVTVVGLALSARLYLFAVLPTLGLCTLLARIS